VACVHLGAPAFDSDSHNPVLASGFDVEPLSFGCHHLNLAATALQGKERIMNALNQANLRVQRRPAVTAMGIGLLLTVITLIALIIDQASGSSIADHVNALYAPLGLHPDPNVLFGYLYVIGGIGVLLWLTMIWGVRRDKRWARVVASFVLVVATSLALLVLFVSEYGGQIFPTLWGILGLLPCLAGLVAVILLWTPGRVVEPRT
jgi:hypothetical protein